MAKKDDHPSICQVNFKTQTSTVMSQSKKHYLEIFENNKEWVANKLSLDPDYFKKLSKTQTPEFLYIGCADSRIPANEIMGLQPGEVFVHRNIANMVVGTDANINAVIQYSVQALKVKHIIVCGHYGCGGVKAAMESQDMGELSHWLQNVRDVYRLHQTELDSFEDDTARYQRLVELNIVEQCINLIKNYHIQRSWYDTGYPLVHGWVYNLENGYLRDLELNMPEVIKDIRPIYDLKTNKK